MRPLSILLLLLAGALPAAPVPVLEEDRPAIAMNSPEWRLASSRNGIALFTAKVKGTGIVPVKGVMIVPGSIEEISAVLDDMARRADWIDHFGRSELLQRRDDYDQTEYLRMKMPWPLTDRTAVVRVRISVSADKNTATIAAASTEDPAAAPLFTGVRSLVYASTFQMTRAGKFTEVSTIAFIDPRGNLPQWVVNFFTSQVARHTLDGLRRQVARRLYSPEQLAAMGRRIQDYGTHTATAGAGRP